MTVIRDVPYRRWRVKSATLVDCREGKRVMALMHRSMAAGKAVEFWLNPPINPDHKPDAIYDTISLTITD